MNAAGRSRRQSKRKKQEDRAAAAPMAPPFLRLPDVLVEEVLRRLPPKSLARCRCVSPSWNALTSSSAFADHYHAAAAARSAASASAARFVSVPVEHPGEHPHIARRSPEFGSPRCVDCPRVFSGGGKPCHGSGVVLVGRPCKGEFFVCNPSTGGILRLPPRRPSCGIAGAGLGFHPAAGNHKAVLLERVDEPPRRGGLIPRLQLLVFDVAVGVHRQRRWRSPRGKKQTLVAYDDDAVVSTTNTNAVFAGGHLHWILSAASGPSGEPRGILSFSAAGESVARLPLPPFSTADATAYGHRERPVHATMAELDGSLCLVHDRRRRRQQDDAADVFDVWRLKDHESGSWSLERRIDLTRHARIELFLPWYTDIVLVSYMGGDGESSGERRKKIMLATMQSAHVYEPDTGELRTVARTKDDTAISQCMSLVLYQESIVHVDGMEYGKEGIKFEFIT